jgi:hypothetical protein
MHRTDVPAARLPASLLADPVRLNPVLADSAVGLPATPISARLSRNDAEVTEWRRAVKRRDVAVQLAGAADFSEKWLRLLAGHLPV